jgi:hypothetical protein
MVDGFAGIFDPEGAILQAVSRAPLAPLDYAPPVAAAESEFVELVTPGGRPARLDLRGRETLYLRAKNREGGAELVEAFADAEASGQPILLTVAMARAIVDALETWRLSTPPEQWPAGLPGLGEALRGDLGGA